MEIKHFKDGTVYCLTTETDTQLTLSKSVSKNSQKLHVVTNSFNERHGVAFLMTDDTDEEIKEMVAFISLEEAKEVIAALTALINR